MKTPSLTKPVFPTPEALERLVPYVFMAAWLISGLAVFVGVLISEGQPGQEATRVMQCAVAAVVSGYLAAGVLVSLLSVTHGIAWRIIGSKGQTENIFCLPLVPINRHAMPCVTDNRLTNTPTARSTRNHDRHGTLHHADRRMARQPLGDGHAHKDGQPANEPRGHEDVWDEKLQCFRSGEYRFRQLGVFIGRCATGVGFQYVRRNRSREAVPGRGVESLRI